MISSAESRGCQAYPSSSDRSNIKLLQAQLYAPNLTQKMAVVYERERLLACYFFLVLFCLGGKGSTQKLAFEGGRAARKQSNKKRGPTKF